VPVKTIKPNGASALSIPQGSLKGTS
jgi:hypothetical protein